MHSTNAVQSYKIMHDAPSLASHFPYFSLRINFTLILQNAKCMSTILRNFANMIDRRTVDEIYNRADIVEVISEFVQLKRAGVSYKGLCPFHNERTPSFFVTPGRNIFKCFSCGKGGNVVNFLMEHEQMSYPEALRWLAKKYNIEVIEKEITPEEKLARDKRESLFIVNDWASQYFQNNLHNTEEGQSLGLAYFRNRGLRDDIIQKFQLGYSMQAYDALSTAALKQGYSRDYLMETGLCYQRDNGQLNDKFRGRVMYPVHTISGKTVAFGGRILGNSDKAAKYMNSPESEIYKKKNELYGLYQAKKSIGEKQLCYLVEGYMDVIAMHQSGVENVVASSGTSLTEEQIRLLHRFTNNITVLYDGDSAGIKATLRSIDLLLKEGMNIKMLLLPDGDDPDSFSRKHTAQEFQDYIELHQEDFIKFKMRILMTQAGNDPAKRSAVVRSIVESIALVQDAITRSFYIQECSALLHMGEYVLTREVSRQRRANYQQMKQEEDRRRQQEQRLDHPLSAPLDDTPVPVGATPTAGSAIAPPQPQAAAPRTPAAQPAPLTARQKVEVSLIQIVVRYGEKAVREIPLSPTVVQSISVIEYIHAELTANNISFTLPVHQQLWELALQHSKEPGFQAQVFFSRLPDAQLGQTAIQLLSENYLLSESFGKNLGVQSMERRLPKLVPALISKLKLGIVEDQIRELKGQLKNNPEAAQDAQLLAQYAQLTRLKQTLSRQCNETNINL